MSTLNGRPSSALYFLLLISAILLALVFAWDGSARAATPGEVRTIYLTDESVAEIQVSGQGTVLSFPIKPTQVILGKKGAFLIEYVESDIAITPMSAGARSRLFVYLYGRRFSFDLVGGTSGAAIILVRDGLLANKTTASKRRPPKPQKGVGR